MKNIYFLASLVALAACQADEVEVKLNGSDVIDAANGETLAVSFEAEVGEQFTEVDDEKRETISNVVDIIKNYFPDSEVEVDYSGSGYSIEIEGDLALTSKRPSDGAPWYISATKHSFQESIKVSLATSGTFSNFEEELKGINFMLSADEFQPIEFKFKADAGMVILSGAEIDGIPTGIDAIEMVGKRLNMSFEDGVWKKTAASFLYIP